MPSIEATLTVELSLFYHAAHRLAGWEVKVNDIISNADVYHQRNNKGRYSMADYKIIDAHVHTYPSKEIGLQAKQGSDITNYSGTIDELLSVMNRAAIHKAVMVSMLPVTEMRDAAITALPKDISQSDSEKALKEIDARIVGRIERKNAWACSVGKEHSNLIPFITVDPVMGEQSIAAEIRDKVKNQGAKGIKLHPASQSQFPNHHSLWPIYQTAMELGIPIVFHSGRSEGSAIEYAEPRYFAEVLESFPKLTLVLAHLGNNFFDQSTALAGKYRNVQFDCCAIVNYSVNEGGLSDPDFTALIKNIGTERVMFGSDYPWLDPGVGIKRIMNLNLTEQEKRQLLGENAIRIYHLS